MQAAEVWQQVWSGMCDNVTLSKLSTTQRAMVGASQKKAEGICCGKFTTTESEQERATVGAKLATLKNGSNQHTKEEGSQNCPRSIEDAATTLSVSKSSIKTAKQVIDSKSKPLIEAVEAGEVSVSLAAKLISETDDELIETQGDPWAYVWSSMMRKNHDKSQLSIYAAEWQKVVGPKKRGPKKKGKANSGNGAGNTNEDKRDEAAKKFGIGGRTVSKAANVLEKGCKRDYVTDSPNQRHFRETCRTYRKPKPPDAP